MRDRKVKEPIVSIARSSTEQASLRDALELLPMDEIIKKQDRVVITPNWVTAKQPSSGAVVGPETLRELIRYIKELGPRNITVATGSGGDTVRVFHQVGYDRILEEEKVGFIDLNYGPYTELELNHPVIPETKINRLIDEMDVLVSFAQLKQHEEATISAAIKNIAMGWPPGEIHGFPKKQLGIHKDLHGFIAAMAKKLPIDLSVISVDKAMIGTGPNNGIAVNTQGLMIASTDPVAADTVGARLLGFLPQAVHYLYTLHQSGIGEADLNKITFRGITLEEAERIFSVAAYGREIVLDKV
jgi:uncharacterized protein (DUF362 family)